MARTRLVGNKNPSVPLNSGRFLPGATNLDYVVEPPRKPASGKTNAEEIRDRVAQKSGTRETPVRRIDPTTGEWISTRSEAVPNDRVTTLLNMVFDADPEVRALAAETFRALPVEQKKAIAIEVANQFPNPRGVVGWSPMGEEIMGMLQGKPPSPERLRAINEAAQAGTGRAGWTGEKGVVRGEPTQNMEFDDSSSVEMAPESNIDNLNQPAPGDLAAITEGTRRPKMPKSGEVTVEQDKRPDLRGPQKETQIVAKDGRNLPVQIQTDKGKIGPQDYRPILGGREYENALAARGQALEEALRTQFGDIDEFRSQLAEATRSGDKERVNELMGIVKEIQDEIEQRITVPDRPYPVNEINASNSERGAEAKLTDHAMRFAAGDPASGARLWKMLSRSKETLSPKAAGIATPEDYADTIIARMDPDRLPGNLADFRERLIANAREQYYSGNPIPSPGPASAEPDKFARNPLTIGREPKRPSELDSWDAAAQRRGPNANIDTEQVKGRDLGATPAAKQFPGLASLPIEQQAALVNSAALARQNGFIPYRDPETGAIIRGRVTSNTTPEKLQFMLDNHAADLVPADLPGHPAGHQVEEMNARIQKFQTLLDSMKQGGGRTGSPFTDADKEALAARPDPFDPSWQEVAPGQRVRLKGQGDTFGFIDDTVDPDDVLYNPNSQYDIEVQDDIPFLKERAEDARPMDVADDSSVVGSEDLSPEESHAALVRVIADPSSSEEAIAKARADYAQYNKVLQSIQDPEQRAAFDARYMQPLRDAAEARRAALASNPAVADNVRDNLDASATPIDDDASPSTAEVITPKDEDPSIHSDSNLKPQEPPKPVEAVANQNADAQSAASDAQAEAADQAAKADAAANPNPNPSSTQASATAPNTTSTSPQPAPGQAAAPSPAVVTPSATPAATPTIAGRVANAASSVRRNWPWWLAGGAAMLGSKWAYDSANENPSFAGAEPDVGLYPGDQAGQEPVLQEMPAATAPLSPEERIRRARMMLNGQGRRLIPQTLSRPT
jgi:hypothetical protein